MMRTQQRILVAIGAALILTLAARAQQPPNPLTLEQAIALALDRNPALKATAEEKSIARAQTDQARAAFLPRVDFSQGVLRGNNPVFVFGSKLTQRRFTAADFALPSLNAPTPVTNHQTQFTGRMLLWDSLVSIERVRGAKKMESAADFQLEQERQNLMLRVVRAYYGVVVARENLAAAREALKTAEANEQRVAAMEKAGLVVTSDLLSAQVFRAQMKEREIRAANQVELARAALAHELGVAAEALGEPSESLAEAGRALGSLAEWEQTALRQRPALRAAELQHQAATSGRKQSQYEFGPKVGAFATFERDAESLAGGASGTNWIAGLRLEWNLFAGGADRARLAEARARERQAGSLLESLRSGIRLEVRQAYLETAAAQQRVLAAQGAAEQARESLRILQNRYEAGLATMTDLLRAQTAQLEARTAYLAALHDLQVARAALERAAGSLTADTLKTRSAADTVPQKNPGEGVTP